MFLRESVGVGVLLAACGSAGEAAVGKHRHRQASKKFEHTRMWTRCVCGKSRTSVSRASEKSNCMTCAIDHGGDSPRAVIDPFGARTSRRRRRCRKRPTRPTTRADSRKSATAGGIAGAYHGRPASCRPNDDAHSTVDQQKRRRQGGGSVHHADVRRLRGRGCRRCGGCRGHAGQTGQAGPGAAGSGGGCAQGGAGRWRRTGCKRGRLMSRAAGHISPADFWQGEGSILTGHDPSMAHRPFRPDRR